MNPRLGVCLYTIKLDGCLNGLFTNEDTQGEIFNEICKRRLDGLPQDTLIGIYDTVYFDVDGDSHPGELTIEAHQSFQNVFQFQWRNRDGNNVFAGVGYLMSPRQVVVRYEGAT